MGSTAGWRDLSKPKRVRYCCAYDGPMACMMRTVTMFMDLYSAWRSVSMGSYSSP